jgi:hypothetical protein
MDLGLTIYVVLCLAIGMMGLEMVDYGRWRWSLAGMLKVVTLVGVVVALGRLIAMA